jgi:ATPase subunit of ABC transporter with duplicated ATPase domains
VEPYQKWALVGANGAGKSTLLKAALHEIGLGNGSVTIATTAQVGYLQQTAVAGSTKTVYDEAASGMTAIHDAYTRMQQAANDNDLVALERATTQYEALGGYQQEQKVSAVLKGLGFTNLEQTCDQLSGGWQMRVALAKTLLSESTLTLLDEPSNHLDASAKKWLARYLQSYDNGSLILVTHDTDLLNAMDHIAEVIPGAPGLQIYKSCNYHQYLALKEQRAAAAVTEFTKNQEKAAKLQAFVDKWGASATKATAAQSRVKQIERMEKEGLLQAPPDAVIAQRFKPSLVLPDPPKAMSESLMALKDAVVGHDTNQPLVSNVNLEIVQGMKLLIRGPNGAGKVRKMI